jgi:hypothetical protein
MTYFNPEKKRKEAARQAAKLAARATYRTLMMGPKNASIQKAAEVARKFAEDEEWKDHLQSATILLTEKLDNLQQIQKEIEDEGADFQVDEFGEPKDSFRYSQAEDVDKQVEAHKNLLRAMRSAWVNFLRESR